MLKNLISDQTQNSESNRTEKQLRIPGLFLFRLLLHGRLPCLLLFTSLFFGDSGLRFGLFLRP